MKEDYIVCIILEPAQYLSELTSCKPVSQHSSYISIEEIINRQA